MGACCNSGGMPLRKLYSVRVNLSTKVLDFVQLGGPEGTVDSTEASRATLSVARPAKKLPSGIGTVKRIGASPGMTMISLTKDSMKALRSVSSLYCRKSFISLA